MHAPSFCLFALLLVVSFKAVAEIDASSGLINAPGFELVKSQCTICHSGSLIVSQRLREKEWVRMIRWMQEEQGLWSLGNLEEPIVRYLTKHYGVSVDFNSRRKPLNKDIFSTD
tara:strand:- start:30 stop:371 length:342 start_codon:yes stop_codon:yes gene_type:complete